MCRECAAPRGALYGIKRKRLRDKYNYIHNPGFTCDEELKTKSDFPKVFLSKTDS